MKRTKFLVLGTLLLALVTTFSYSVMATSKVDSPDFFQQRGQMRGFGPQMKRQGYNFSIETAERQECHRIDFDNMSTEEILVIQAEMKAGKQERLNQAINAGLISQEEADEIFAQMEARELPDTEGIGLMMKLKHQIGMKGHHGGRNQQRIYNFSPTP